MKKWILEFQHLFWYAIIILLPISSMPLVRKMVGSDTVASPSIIPLIILCVIWLVYGLMGDLHLSKSVLPLALFFGFALVVTCLSFFYQLPAYKAFNEIGAPLNAIATLIIGSLFFITASSFPVFPKIKENTLRLLNWGGFFIILWSAMQAISWYSMNGYPQWMFNFQGLFSSRVLYRQRVTGFALEPSWLAHQLNLVYLPYWFSATLKRYSSFKFKFFRFSLENILLAAGIITLGLTLSRVGYLAFLSMAIFVLWMIHKKLVNKICLWIIERKEMDHKPMFQTRRLVSLGLICSYIFTAFALLVLYSRLDPRMMTLFSFQLDSDNPLLRYFNELKFGDSVIYWLAGWKIFNEYPVFGVGLGNAGFYIPQNIEPFGWSLIEVRRLINRELILLNIKSLWLRLLAESGIIGFSLFFGWLISLIAIFLKKIRSRIHINQVLGLMGILSLLAMIFEGFSIDSFAMPYWWVALGFSASLHQQLS